MGASHLVPRDVTTAEFSLGEIGQISVTARDLERAVAFYRDTLGVKPLFSVPKMAFFDCDGLRLMLAVPEKPEHNHPSSILYFRVPDIQRRTRRCSRVESISRASLVLVAPMAAYDLWMAFFRDSEQNLLALMSEVPKKTDVCANSS